MRWQISKRAVHRITLTGRTLALAGLFSVVTSVCFATDSTAAPPQLPPRPDIRSGGVIEESYVYHRQRPANMAGAVRSVEPAGGWYGYGFPVSTFRWGWFGSAHYYPTVFWHDGYYGDCCRYGYRRGY
jgi:hypothetical protein